MRVECVGGVLSYVPFEQRRLNSSGPGCLASFVSLQHRLSGQVLCNVLSFWHIWPTYQCRVLNSLWNP